MVHCAVVWVVIYMEARLGINIDSTTQELNLVRLGGTNERVFRRDQ
jgi:hypothetical protein